MKVSFDTFGIPLVIAAVVGAGAWYARDPDFTNSPLPYFRAGPTAESPLPPLISGRLDWAGDDELVLATAGNHNRLTLYDLRQKASRTLMDGSHGRVSTSALAGDGRHVLVATDQGSLWWIDREAPDGPTRLVHLSDTKVTGVAIAADGGLVAAGTDTGLIFICDPKQSASSGFKITSASEVTDVQFSRDGKRLVSAHYDGGIRVWDLVTMKALPESGRHESRANAAAFLPDGQRAISAGADDTIRMWEIASGRELWRQEADVIGVTTLAVSPDGSNVAWGGFGHLIVVWDLANSSRKFEIHTSSSVVAHLRFSPDGSQLAAVEKGVLPGTIGFYEMQCGTEVKRLSMDGQRLP